MLFTIEKKRSGKYVFNTAWMLLEPVMRLLVSLVVMAKIARHLGTESYGIYAFSIGAVTVFDLLARYGVDAKLVSSLVENKGSKSKENKIFLKMFYLRAFSSLLMFFTLNAFNFFSYDRPVSLILLIFSLTVLLNPFELSEKYLESEVRAIEYVKPKLFIFLIFSAIKLGSISFGLTIEGLVFLMLLEKIFIAFSHILIIRKYRLLNFHSGVVWREYFLLFRKMLPLAVCSYYLFVFYRLDTFIVKRFLDEANLGFYFASNKLFEVISFIPLIIANSLFPKLVENSKVFGRVNQKKSNLYFISAIILPVLLIMLTSLFSGRFLIISFFGDDFLGAVRLMSYHSLPFFGFALLVVSYKYIVVSGIEKSVMKIGLSLLPVFLFGGSFILKVYPVERFIVFKGVFLIFLASISLFVAWSKQKKSPHLRT